MKTIVAFHTGRGGHFYNAGHRSFLGEKSIQDLMNVQSDKLFSEKENQRDIYRNLKSRNLDNLIDLLDSGNFDVFEKRTKLSLGDDLYVDCNGNVMITASEAATGVGELDWDGQYDTDTCMYLSECDKDDLMLILEAGYEYLIQEYFDDNTDLSIDWKKFTGNYRSLLTDYFDFNNVDAEEFYHEEE